MPQTPDNAPPRSFSYRLLPLFACTVGWGIVTVMLGPLLPALIARWHIQDAQAGTLFTASFAGQLIGACVATRNLRLSLLCGAAFSAIGTATLAWTSFSAAHLALFVVGLGIGLGLTAGNVVAGTSTPHRTRALALFNVSWSLGAIACPALVHLCGPLRTRLFFLITALLVTLGGLLAATLPRAFTAPAQSSKRSSAKDLRPFPLSLVSLLFFALSMLLYIGNENALAGWLPSFAVRNSPVFQASTVALLYWLSEFVIRLLLAGPLQSISEAVLYRGCLLVLLSTQVVLVLTPHPSFALILLATLISGAAIGPLYPLIVAFLLARTGNHPGVGPIFASSSLGGATLPWLTGLVSTYFGGLRSGLAVPALALLLMLLLSPGILPHNRAATTLSD